MYFILINSNLKKKFTYKFCTKPQKAAIKTNMFICHEKSAMMMENTSYLRSKNLSSCTLTNIFWVSFYGTSVIGVNDFLKFNVNKKFLNLHYLEYWTLGKN